MSGSGPIAGGVTTTEGLIEAGRPAKPANLWRDTGASILRQRSAVVGLILLIALVLMAIFAPLIATHDPNKSLLGQPGEQRRTGPCIHLLGCPADQPEHLFGTDGNARDVYSRVVYGARTSLTVGLGAVTFAIVIGTAIGAIAGFVTALGRQRAHALMDVVLAFPSLLLAIAIVTAAGRSLFNALLAIAIVSIPVYARIARSAVLTTREQDFVTASRALGESSIGILTRRILPNSFTPLVVQGTLDIGTAVLGVAALAFIGVTGDLSNPEWGSMIGLEKDQLFNAPHIILAPGIAITITVLAFNLLGDGLRDALDPRLNR